MGTLITAREAGAYLGKPAKTLANWRSQRIGPVYYKVHGSIRYSTDDLDAYLAEHRVVPNAALVGGPDAVRARRTAPMATS